MKKRHNGIGLAFWAAHWCRRFRALFCRNFHAPVCFGQPAIHHQRRWYPYRCQVCGFRWQESESFSLPRRSAVRPGEIYQKRNG